MNKEINNISAKKLSEKDTEKITGGSNVTQYGNYHCNDCGNNFTAPLESNIACTNPNCKSINVVMVSTFTGYSKLL